MVWWWDRYDASNASLGSVGVGGMYGSASLQCDAEKGCTDGTVG